MSRGAPIDWLHWPRSPRSAHPRWGGEPLSAPRWHARVVSYAAKKGLVYIGTNGRLLRFQNVTDRLAATREHAGL